MGKHTDKINRSKKRTFPKVLGYPGALFACGATVVAPHIILATTFVRERLLQKAAGPTIPWGSALAFLTLFRELPASLKAFRLGQTPLDKPTMPFGTILKGTIIDANVERAWPLWFVAFCGWHAISFTYLLVIGGGLEWAIRAMLKVL
eukprot:CAMPEP_0118687924 /NCGR_PEP_ID=MMETSP0800-20121206/8645_1 /TAXON_ID=210618 ORGANISM="Striatella unipunctata, Strain CCMP2910" /NCGR_SAMPLE_ID=MMETSP0800 /ASSEMBLY_ACC=CAM_ASM_000638 /LENGTH=147 /DNA_ID=CAMNT_0006585147 /DNA_START=271 /DNA_END=717 /DNA_ORIENTATION=-